MKIADIIMTFSEYAYTPGQSSRNLYSYHINNTAFFVRLIVHDHFTIDESTWHTMPERLMKQFSDDTEASLPSMRAVHRSIVIELLEHIEIASSAHLSRRVKHVQVLMHNSAGMPDSTAERTGRLFPGPRLRPCLEADFVDIVPARVLAPYDQVIIAIFFFETCKADGAIALDRPAVVEFGLL
jgi:hypothetical protein